MLHVVAVVCRTEVQQLAVASGFLARLMVGLRVGDGCDKLAPKSRNELNNLQVMGVILCAANIATCGGALILIQRSNTAV